MSKRDLVGDEATRVLRDMEDRIKRLERSQTLILGGWRVEVDPTTNQLTATYVPTGSTTVLAAP